MNSNEELLSVLLTCDIIVYHIVESANQVDESSYVVQGMEVQSCNY